VVFHPIGRHIRDLRTCIADFIDCRIDSSCLCPAPPSRESRGPGQVTSAAFAPACLIRWLSSISSRMRIKFPDRAGTPAGATRMTCQATPRH